MSVRATIVLGQLLHMVSKMVNLSNYVLSTFHLVVKIIDILYTLDSASNYSEIQKLKP